MIDGTAPRKADLPDSRGWARTFTKGLVRLVFVERTIRGTLNLWRGVKDGRVLARDASWQPMPPLEA